MPLFGSTTPERAIVLRQLAARVRTFARTRRGHVLLLLLATLGWAALWAWFDIMVVRLAFPPPLSPAASTPTYWAATWGFIFPLATLLAFREHAWLPYLAVIVGAWEDVLFYWILLLPVPANVELSFYGRAAVFLPLAIVGEIASHRLAFRHRVLAVAALVVVGAFFNLGWLALTLAAVVVYLGLRELVDLLSGSAGIWQPRPRTPKPR